MMMRGSIEERFGFRAIKFRRAAEVHTPPIDYVVARIPLHVMRIGETRGARVPYAREIQMVLAHSIDRVPKSANVCRRLIERAGIVEVVSDAQQYRAADLAKSVGERDNLGIAHAG